MRKGTSNWKKPFLLILGFCYNLTIDSPQIGVSRAEARSVCQLTPVWQCEIPVVTSYVVAAVVWKWLFDADIGLFNQWLSYLRLPPVAWLLDSRIALSSLVFMAIWKNSGYKRQKSTAPTAGRSFAM